MPANENLGRDVAELLRRAMGRPSRKPLAEYKGFLYKAASWISARWVAVRNYRMGLSLASLTEVWNPWCI